MMRRIDYRQLRSTWTVQLVAAPGVVALALVLISGVPDLYSSLLLLVLTLILTYCIAVWLRGPLAHRLRTLTNLIDALKEGDYGVRGVAPLRATTYGELVQRINALADHLQKERVGLHESLQLLTKTLVTLDSAVFAFEADARLRLVNPAGEKLLGQTSEALLGKHVDDLGLANVFELPSGSTQACVFPTRSGRWQVTHASLRSQGRPGRLLVIQPIEKALRQEEAQAFGRLLRVLSHEINNSMAPIISAADTLDQLSQNRPMTHDVQADLHEGLRMINKRGAALQRFIGGYAKLAQLPEPQLASVSVRAVVEHVCNLLNPAQIRVVSDEDIAILADRDQLEQVLINLLHNAIEASAGNGVVEIHWCAHADNARIEIIDSGHGLPTSDSLFVPFFTTKPGGSGIGLVLSRQIIEAQQGSMELYNRHDTAGAVAAIELPRSC